MQKIRALYHFAACAVKWSAVFAVSHLTVRHLGLPDSRTIPLALAAGSAVVIGEHLLKTSKNRAAHPQNNRPASRKASRRPALPRHPFLMLLAAPGSSIPPSVTQDPAWFALPHEDAADLTSENAGGSDCWRPVLKQLSTGRHADPLLGTAIILDAGHLLQSTPAKILREAAGIRERLLLINRAAGKNPPVYLVVDNLDVLYGLRSLVLATPAGRLAQPLGALVRSNLEEGCAAFAKAVHAEALADLLDAADLTSSSPDAAVLAAGMQAPAEFKRLETPLVRFAEELFDHPAFTDRFPSKHPGVADLQPEPVDAVPSAPCPGGIFYTASCPGAVTLPPLLGNLATFSEVSEPQPDSPSWFTRDLFSLILPADSARKKTAISVKRAGIKFTAAAGWLAAACLALSGLITWSFLENRQTLLRLSLGSPIPESAEELGDYLNLAAIARDLSSTFSPARFGLAQTRDVADELQRRYVESYYDLKTIPAIESLQESVFAAAGHADPAVIGNTLLMLIILREGITGGEISAGDPDSFAPLQAIAEAKGLVSRSDLHLLAVFSDWAGDRDWLGDAHSAIRQLEENLLDNAHRGNPTWLSAWLAGIPGLEEVRLDGIFEGSSHRPGPGVVIPAAFGRDGYRVAAGLMGKVAESGDTDRRRRHLRHYRRQALEAWRRAATELFAGERECVAAADVRDGIHRAVRREDPLARFAALACRHLLPMLDPDDRDAEPDLLWLAEYARLAGRIDGDISAPALRQADALAKSPPGEIPAAAGRFGAMAARFSQTIRDLAGDLAGDNRENRFASYNPDRGGNQCQTRGAWVSIPGSGANSVGVLSAEDDWENLLVQLKKIGLASQDASENLDQVRKFFTLRRENSAGAPGSPTADFPLSGAEFYANRLHRHLREFSGSGGWDGLSPLSSLRRFQRLLVRLAALSLDSIWRDTVYNPVRLTSGGEALRRERMLGAGGLLEKFLTGPAAGFWDWEEGKIVNARGDGTEFHFSPGFLDYCNIILAQSRAEIPESIPLLFRVDSVQVDPGARERPEAVEFFLTGAAANSSGPAPADKRSGEAGAKQSFSHRNYPKAHQFNLSPQVVDSNPACQAGLRIKFRSSQAEAVFEGADGVRRFIELFSRKTAWVRPEAFGLEGEAILKKLRVSGVKINGEITGAEEFLRLPRTTLPDLPERIIHMPNAAVDSPSPDGVFVKKVSY